MGVDLFGRPHRRQRVLRTSNAYTSAQSILLYSARDRLNATGAHMPA
jgi:hypothetical protein